MNIDYISEEIKKAKIRIIQLENLKKLKEEYSNKKNNKCIIKNSI